MDRVCGIAGIFSTDGVLSSARREAVEAMRDRLAHRGPDGAGLWEGPGAALGHRRLAVVDLSAAAAQPMTTSDGRFVISYNGELYNDAEIRRDLSASGVSFRTVSDTETMLQVLATWGADGLRRCRGMYAFCFVDTARHVAILGRDPLGVKPLYIAETAARVGEPASFGFASEPGAFVAMPGFEIQPDGLGVAAYLTTSRTTFAERTMFRGVSIVRPGQIVRVNYAGDSLRVSVQEVGEAGSVARDVARVVRESVITHLRSDVPLCALLSGGLDSSIIAAVTCGEIAREGKLRTYCSGARGATAPGGDDFAFARLVSERLGTAHTEVPVTQDSFARLWSEIVSGQLVPLSTPNEVAIYEVARVLRSEGHKVALSGEGADELFGGYDLALAQSARFRDGSHALVRNHPALGPGAFELRANAWLSPDAYHDVLTPQFLTRIGRGDELTEIFEREFAESASRAQERGHDDPLQAHLCFQQRMNLSGLLLRLDSATMCAGVEGRTPFADARVRAIAESLPMSDKFDVRGDRVVSKTKIALRRAFAGMLPQEVVAREKASFPLPFQNWIGCARRAMLESEALREFVREDAIQTAAANPSQYWHLAWPIANLAHWLEAIENTRRPTVPLAA
ncbi:MAG: asparagine synthase (glutamine-hydrolyzing) [Phycisphaeraceae bacterium]|nr:asparagine synthase (glutamine-hydrolyzing) [Phycisphaeraceae bacterium]